MTANQWGFGTGIETPCPLGSAVDLSASVGIDLYADADFIGHDFTYSPDNVNVEPKEPFPSSADDKAVNQPRLAPRLEVGITRRPGP